LIATRGAHNRKCGRLDPTFVAIKTNLSSQIEASVNRLIAI